MSGKIIAHETKCYPQQTDSSFLGCPSQVELTVVLVEGGAFDYAAYVGCGSLEWVASQGNKISFAEAELYFNGLKKEKYRG